MPQNNAAIAAILQGASITERSGARIARLISERAQAGAVLGDALSTALQTTGRTRVKLANLARQEEDDATVTEMLDLLATGDIDPRSVLPMVGQLKTPQGQAKFVAGLETLRTIKEEERTDELHPIRVEAAGADLKRTRATTKAILGRELRDDELHEFERKMARLGVEVGSETWEQEKYRFAREKMLDQVANDARAGADLANSMMVDEQNLTFVTFAQRLSEQGVKGPMLRQAIEEFTNRQAQFEGILGTRQHKAKLRENMKVFTEQQRILRKFERRMRVDLARATKIGERAKTKGDYVKGLLTHARTVAKSMSEGEDFGMKDMAAIGSFAMGSVFLQSQLDDGTLADLKKIASEFADTGRITKAGTSRLARAVAGSIFPLISGDEPMDGRAELEQLYLLMTDYFERNREAEE
jgi:hypothetical protein